MMPDSSFVTRQITPPENKSTVVQVTEVNTTTSRRESTPLQAPSGTDPVFPTNTNSIGPTQGSQLSVLVTGATGTAGYEILKHLCSRELKNRFKVVAGIHNDHPGNEILNDCDVVRHIDEDDLGQLKFTGVDMLLIVPSNAENRIEQVQNYTQAAVRDGVKFILLLSLVQPLTERGKTSIFARQFKQMETIVSECGVPCTYLRCSFFMQNLLAHAYEIATESILSLPIGRGSCSPVNVIDTARAACAILLDPTTHSFKAYDLTGPDVLSGDEIARAASRAFGRRVLFRDCSAEEFIDMYVQQGVPKWLATGFYEILDLHATGQYSSGEAKSFYQDLTGFRPIVIEEFFRDFEELFMSTQSDTDELPRPTLKSHDRRKRRDHQGMFSSTYPDDRYNRSSKSKYQNQENQYEIGDSRQLHALLDKLMAVKQSNLQARYAQIKEEEQDMNQLMDAFEMLQSSNQRPSRNHRHRSSRKNLDQESDTERFYPPGRDDRFTQSRRNDRRYYV